MTDEQVEDMLETPEVIQSLDFDGGEWNEDDYTHQTAAAVKGDKSELLKSSLIGLSKREHVESAAEVASRLRVSEEFNRSPTSHLAVSPRATVPASS